MKILVVEPYKEPEIKDIDGSLESMQQVVDGYIEAIYPFEEHVALVCNEEGKLLGLPMNRNLPEASDIICGTFFLCEAPPTEETFTSLTDEQFARYTERFKSPEMFLQTEEGLLILSQ